MDLQEIPFLSQTTIVNKRVLLRADFDISLNLDQTIADDTRIRSNLPTIKYLLNGNNRIICIAKLGRPKGRDEKYSLKNVCIKLKEYLQNKKIILISDFLTENSETFKNQKPDEIFILENIRYYPEEKTNDPNFTKKLASLADIFINDAFAVSHRIEASVVGIPQYLPSFAGLSMEKEIEIISSSINHPKKPFVAILGGSKISSKIGLIDQLLELSDQLLIGGGLANTFLSSQGTAIGKSLYEYEEVEKARRLLFNAAQKKSHIVLPVDVVVSTSEEEKDNHYEVKKYTEVLENEHIFDIGPETMAMWGNIIAKAKTIIWNGPVGLFEKKEYRNGTDFIYYTITQNRDAISIVGGGDTLAAISKKEYLERITHISTGGGAMLEFIEKGTLPGIEALIYSKK